MPRDAYTGHESNYNYSSTPNGQGNWNTGGAYTGNGNPTSGIVGISPQYDVAPSGRFPEQLAAWHAAIAAARPSVGPQRAPGAVPASPPRVVPSGMPGLPARPMGQKRHVHGVKPQQPQIGAVPIPAPIAAPVIPMPGLVPARPPNITTIYKTPAPRPPTNNTTVFKSPDTKTTIYKNSSQPTLSDIINRAMNGASGGGLGGGGGGGW